MDGKCDHRRNLNLSQGSDSFRFKHLVQKLEHDPKHNSKLLKIFKKDTTRMMRFQYLNIFFKMSKLFVLVVLEMQTSSQ